MPDKKGKKKFDLNAIRDRLASERGRRAWRSLDELTESDDFMEFLKEEFPRQATLAGALSRRDFLKLLAAPLALAGLTSCLPQPIEKIFPYNEAPEGLVPGQPLFFATAMPLDGYATGLLAESHEGRPTKLEGNPQHPASLGSTDAFSQGSILSLYDPDRAQTVSHQGSIETWDTFLSALTGSLDSLRGAQGAGLSILTGTVTSPTLAGQINSLLQQLPRAKWHQWVPVGRGNTRTGTEMAFGQTVNVTYNFKPANVILSLDNDFTFWEPGSVRYARQFASRRKVTQSQAEMNRLYLVESSMSPLSGSADHRLPLQAGRIEAFARLVASRLGIEAGPAAEVPGVPSGWVDAVVADLQANQGASLVIAGEKQPPAVHALAHAMNQALGNAGQTVNYTAPVEANPVDQAASLRELVDDLNAGRVRLLVVLDGNPVFSAPADLKFADAFLKAGLRVYQGLYDDETAALSTWHIPSTHYLEMWSDERAFDGTVSIIQPLIEPLYSGRSPHELLAVLLGQSGATGYDILRQYWQAQMGGGVAAPTAAPGATPAATGEAPAATPAATAAPATPAATAAVAATAPAANPTQPATTGATPEATGAASTPGAAGGEASPEFEAFWRKALRQGILPDTAAPAQQVSLAADFAAASAPPAGVNGLEIVFEPDHSVWDGRFANNAFLQELPRPITKLTWDNAAYISPNTAARLGLSNEDLVELRYKGRSVRGPVWIVPGQPDDSVTVHLGYGRTRGGKVLEGTGFNAYAIRTSDAPWFGSGLEIASTGDRYPLATTQDHFSMESRDIVRSGTLAQFQQDPEFFEKAAGHSGEEDGQPSLYPEFQYNGHAWGMSINLNACTGCNACVIACQVENNIPVVGKDQVQNSREMHWLRVDAYFNGGLDNPQLDYQPVLCMQCEKAPCEPVCPTEATSHSSEGLNEMTYNRCVGTRYCSNNCPYKVRRFNFYQYVDENVIPLRMMKNPDVTVRNRGVMEKCTYCVQRINAARSRAEIAGQPVRDGDVIPACAQACPSRALVFGDINDEASQVRQLKEEPHNYGLLAELGTQPRTTYLAKLRNPNPSLEQGGAQS